MRKLIVEEWIRAFQVELVQISRCAYVQIKVVTVRCSEIEWHARLRRRRRFRHRRKRSVKTEICRKHERAAVVRVVGKKQVGHRRLRRRSFQRRMRIDDARRSIKT